jgi:hypothetical protein
MERSVRGGSVRAGLANECAHSLQRKLGRLRHEISWRWRLLLLRARAWSSHDKQRAVLTICLLLPSCDGLRIGASMLMAPSVKAEELFVHYTSDGLLNQLRQSLGPLEEVHLRPQPYMTTHRLVYMASQHAIVISFGAAEEHSLTGAVD